MARYFCWLPTLPYPCLKLVVDYADDHTVLVLARMPEFRSFLDNSCRMRKMCRSVSLRRRRGGMTWLETYNYLSERFDTDDLEECLEWNGRVFRLRVVDNLVTLEQRAGAEPEERAHWSLVFQRQYRFGVTVAGLAARTDAYLYVGRRCLEPREVRTVVEVRSVWMPHAIVAQLDSFRFSYAVVRRSKRPHLLGLEEQTTYRWFVLGGEAPTVTHSRPTMRPTPDRYLVRCPLHGRFLYLSMPAADYSAQYFRGDRSESDDDD